MNVHVTRLIPDQDLLKELKELASRKKLRAAVLLTCVGSLKKASLRFANQPGATVIQGPLEIVSLVGTLAESGTHIHLSVSDKEGKTYGGHLLEGSTIYTTAEVAIGEIPDLEFTRELDPKTTYRELKIRKLSKPQELR